MVSLFSFTSRFEPLLVVLLLRNFWCVAFYFPRAGKEVSQSNNTRLSLAAGVTRSKKSTWLCANSCYFVSIHDTSTFPLHSVKSVWECMSGHKCESNADTCYINKNTRTEEHTAITVDLVPWLFFSRSWKGNGTCEAHNCSSPQLHMSKKKSRSGTVITMQHPVKYCTTIVSSFPMYYHGKACTYTYSFNNVSLDVLNLYLKRKNVCGVQAPRRTKSPCLIDNLVCLRNSHIKTNKPLTPSADCQATYSLPDAQFSGERECYPRLKTWTKIHRQSKSAATFSPLVLCRALIALRPRLLSWM